MRLGYFLLWVVLVLAVMGAVTLWFPNMPTVVAILLGGIPAPVASTIEYCLAMNRMNNP